MSKILVTGFEAFDKSALNPSAEIVKALKSDDEGIKKRIQELEAELSLIKNSRIWKLTSFYRRLRK